MIPNNFVDKKSSSSKQSSEGIGVGLYICNMIVEALNGQISVQSSKKVGTLFKFNIAAEACVDESETSSYDDQENKKTVEKQINTIMNHSPK
jgi:K+-sensing histidine kinase KdpD